MTERFLPALIVEFSLSEGETVASGLRRLSLEQFDLILTELNGRGSASFEEAVHQTRKAVKRVRALLRLVRSEIGERAYVAEDQVLRDASRAISAVREEWVLVTTVAATRSRYADFLAPQTFGDCQAAMEQRAIQRRDEIMYGGSLSRVVSRLAAARARYQAWPQEGDGTAGLYGRKPIRNKFSAIEPGLAETYRRGRSEMKVAVGSRQSEDLHSWRKRVKYLKHQLEILTPIFPEMLSATSFGLDRLGEILGEEHDLSELVATLEDRPEVLPNPVERTMLIALSQHRRAQLIDAAAVLGARIYTESPKRFIDRIDAYWGTTG